MSLALGACGDDSSGGDNNGAADTGADATADAGADATDAADAADASDTGPMACQAFPAPQIAGTSATDALAQNPEHCGQDAYTWLTDAANLGEITAIGAEKDFAKGLIESVLAQQNVNAPREVAHDTHVVQFSYVTQDRGETVEASAMVAYPTDRQPEDGPREVLLFLHGTTGFTDACAPSSQLTSQALVALLASFGYFVVAPDYIGLKGVGEPTGFLHPYLVGQPTAIASLDAVRAASKLPADKRGEWCLQPRVAVFGGSQGGHAALWVDRLAPYYAREFEMLGTVATVPPSDLLGQMDRALEQLVSATGNTVAFLGSTAGWYGYQDRLDEVFVSPLDTEVPDALGGGCDFDNVMPDPQSTADIFQQPLIDAAQNDTLASVDPWGCITAENGLTTTSVARIEPESDSYGIMFVLGENDNLVNSPIERDAFEELCGQGMKMEFLECAGAGHGETSFFAMPEILDFLDARLAGETFNSADICQLSDPVQCRGTQ